ncbi:mediator of RNA polymerase II transcription subunit 15 [Nilaparvata lugens]|uniref:mediator of RNA polymerase II transcription subunit 15 n=1 Tax=Nilaparvata lugens TaxID=108931 RepID=UPI00193D5AC7|nr:mediator of RNA polymerase II transcription subunit 15 [Nilaparvata lugens]XP_022191938.2 mediator of RNA polymerase II transcription subunit 15 [Nilaparvata lugens]
MASDENGWRTQSFRQNVVQKIEEAVRSSGMSTTKNSMEMEKHVFQKAKSREEYLGFVARLILHVREINNSKKGTMNGGGGAGGQNMQDPINALQTLARQGTGNQMMGMVPPQQQNQVTATNLLQTLNQRPILQQKLQTGMNTMPMGPMSNQMGGPMGPMNPNAMGGPMPGPMVGQMGPMAGPMGNQMGAQMAGQMNAQMSAQMAGQMAGLGPMGSPISAAQMGGPMPGQMGHLQQRKNLQNEGMMMGGQGAGFVNARNVTPTQFLRQSPTPPHSAQSPASAGLASSNQMVSSPALVPSPNAQMTPNMGGPMRSVGMVASPSSSLNTPGQGPTSVPTPSPCNSQEDQAYREKARQLSKYIDPLRRMIAKMGNGDQEKCAKMKKLLDILSHPSKRMPLETLLKCEVVLEKLDFKRSETGPAPVLREQHPILEALNGHLLQSPLINHTLQRTFGPCLEALFGSDIKTLPPLSRKRKLEEPPDDIPEVLQGEIARLDQRFKVSLDPTQQPGSRSVQLVCWLDDRHLPCVPPVALSVPDDYPQSPPRCHLSPHEYAATSFLRAVQSALEARIRQLPRRFSVSQLLDTWEMSVRQACSPTQTPVSSTTVAMGL